MLPGGGGGRDSWLDPPFIGVRPHTRPAPCIGQMFCKAPAPRPPPPKLQQLELTWCVGPAQLAAQHMARSTQDSHVMHAGPHRGRGLWLPQHSPRAAVR